MVSRVNSSARLNKEDGFAANVTIPSSAVMTLNTVGYTLLAAPVNVQLALFLTELTAKITTGTPYIGIHNMTVGYGTPNAQVPIICTLPGIGFLDQSVPTGVVAVFNGVSNGGYIVSQASNAITLWMGTSNPSQGTSPISISMKYKTHRLP